MKRMLHIVCVMNVLSLAHNISSMITLRKTTAKPILSLQQGALMISQQEG